MSSGELTGRQLGEFVVETKLGEGGFGEVYRARQKGLEREAVVKALKARHAASPEVTERFLREAKLASRLDHPYAAHVYAFGAEPDGLLWIAMELVRGTPLDQILVERGPLPLERLVPLLDRLCEVVHTAHEQGIVHRDLKPANVMVIARAGRMLPKLLDLGVAKVTSDVDSPAVVLDESAPVRTTTRLGDVIGSPKYMAPEQWLASTTVDARTDVYALGVLTYQALTGQTPFAGQTLGEIARAHAQAAVPPVGDGFPAALDEVFRRALAKKQDQRFAGALELAAAFREASGVSAEPEPLPHLPETLRDRWLAAGPQPIAEGLAALDSARNAHQAHGEATRLVRTLARWLAVLALSARRGRSVEERERQAARALHQKHPGPEELLEIARALTRADARRPEIHPVPELVRALHDHDGTLLTRLLREPTGPSGEDAAVRAALTSLLGALGELLERFDFLCDYGVVVGETSWMGTRRSSRYLSPRVGATLEAGKPYLLDGDGRPLLGLSPLVQVEAPAPGTTVELFLLDGAGRRGARLVAAPRGFEKEDEAVWDWLGDKLAQPEESAAQPYRGLATFTAEDAALFFGREREQTQILNRLRVSPFLAFVGASGAGKSSLLYAGVLPNLPEGWQTVRLRPGRAPLLALEAALRSAPKVVVVDQLEELFTLTRDPAERLAFAQRLATCPKVIVTLRDDFLARAGELPPFRELLPPGLVLVTTPTEDDLLRILTLPAERAGYKFDDPELPREMVAAVAGKPGALALLSFTAARLWEERDRSFHLLTRRAYEALGGVAGALAQHAEDTRASMTAEEQHLLREAFRHLVTSAGTRAVLKVSELEDLLGGGTKARSVIDKLVAARLLITTEEERIEVIHEALLDAWPRLVAWRREDAEGARLRDQLRDAARQWDDRGRPNGLLWRGDALAELERWRARFPGAVTATEDAFTAASQADAVRGRRLRRILVGAIIAGLSVALAVTLTFARRATNAQLVAETNAERARAEQSRAEASLVQQLQEQGRQLLLLNDATRAYPYLVEASRRGGQNASLDFLLRRAARLLDRQELILVHARRVNDAFFTRDGARLVTASFDGTAGIWDATTGRQLHILRHAGSVTAAVPHPDGVSVLTGSEDGTADRWEIATGRRLASFSGPDVPVRTLEVDATGTRCLAGGRGAALLWDLSAKALVARLAVEPELEVRRAGFLADGRILTADTSGTLRLWGPRGESLGKVGEDLDTSSLAVAGNLVVQARASGAATVWDFELDRPVSVAKLVGHSAGLYAPAIAPLGATVATTSADQTIRLWPARGGEGRVLAGHEGQIFFASFDGSGRRLVSAGADGVVRIWRTQTAEAESALSGHADQIFRVRFSPDGTRVVSSGFDGTARIWRVSDPELLDAPTASQPPVALSFASAHRLVALGRGGHLSTYVLDGKSLREEGHRELGGDGDIRAAAEREGTWVILRGRDVLRVSPDGALSFLAAGELVAAVPVVEGVVLVTEAGEVNLQAASGATRPWRLTQPMQLRPEPRGELLGIAGRGEVLLLSGAGERRLSISHGSTVVTARVTPSGDRLLTAGTDRLVRVWDRETGKLTASLQGHTDAVVDVVATQDGRYLATSSQDGTVRIWDAQSADVLAIHRLAKAGGRFLAASPDGEWLATAAPDGRVAVIRIGGDPGDLAAMARRLACHVPYVLEAGRLVPLKKVECR